jgi:hypothetical protein
VRVDLHDDDPAVLLRDGFVPPPLAFFRDARQLGAPLFREVRRLSWNLPSRLMTPLSGAPQNGR